MWNIKPSLSKHGQIRMQLHLISQANSFFLGSNHV